MKQLLKIGAFICALFVLTGCPYKRPTPDDMDLTSDEFVYYILNSCTQEEKVYQNEQYKKCCQQLLSKYPDIENLTPHVDEKYRKDEYSLVKNYTFENKDELIVSEEISTQFSSFKCFKIRLTDSAGNEKASDYIDFNQDGNIYVSESIINANGIIRSSCVSFFYSNLTYSKTTNNYNEFGECTDSTSFYSASDGIENYSEWKYLIPGDGNSIVFVYSRDSGPSYYDDEDVTWYQNEYFYKEQGSSSYVFKVVVTKEYKNKTTTVLTEEYKYAGDAVTFMMYGSYGTGAVCCEKKTLCTYNSSKQLQKTAIQTMEYDKNGNYATETTVETDSSGNFLSKVIRKYEYVQSEIEKGYRIKKLTITHYNKDDSVKYYIIITYTEDENGNLPTEYFDSRK